MSAEFDLINTFFKRPTTNTDLGIGDDAALLRVKSGHQLAVSADMLISGTHFFPDASPQSIGWKSLAVNVSDMAAMGAIPRWITLSIALPDVKEPWLEAFAKGFFACANTFNIDLIGGDTTRGPLSISVNIMGEVPTGHALTRHGAQADEDIWVTGKLGSAALGLAHLQDRITVDVASLDEALAALHKPKPRLNVGISLVGIASSCIDISDGLLADLGHILKASKLGANIKYETIPVMKAIHNNLQNDLIKHCILAGGDDYELCFTASKKHRDDIATLSKEHATPMALIGKTTAQTGIAVIHQGNPLSLETYGYDHFT